MLYFAYGSNMSHVQMDERCPGNSFVGPAKLVGYKFVYDGYSGNRKGAVANIIETKDFKDIVWGGLFEISEANRDALDCYEGYSGGIYNRKEIYVHDSNYKKCKALVYYLRDGKEIGKPSEDYRNIILQGAKDCDLPQEYINTYISSKN
jgi:gamma-glutamylcyclotransferase (GGCT)/AIG2-like uncharacterized protein YtfP